MMRVVWICWLQGWNSAPPLVNRCLGSWYKHNPDWDIRPIDLQQLRLLLDLPDLRGRTITAAAFSDLARVMLLHEYGGVWADATLLCTSPLDQWLPDLMAEGFFAFDRPGTDRLLSSWFLAAREGHPLISYWCAAALAYWNTRSQADHYFWFHYLFEEICHRYPTLQSCWARVPKRSAAGPHRAQDAGLGSEDPSQIADVLSDLAPVIKLTYRHSPSWLDRPSLLSTLLNRYAPPVNSAIDIDTSLCNAPEQGSTQWPLATLKVSTENLGDHIQILAARSLLERLWCTPSVMVDRDDDIATGQSLPPGPERIPVVMNGWFKTNRSEWPPHPRILPAFVGFHIRLFQCPELVSKNALKYYQQYGPIGCRDVYTRDCLQAHGIDAYLSHCLSLTVPRRLPCTTVPSEIFVVSRDPRIVSCLPASIGRFTYICHYSGTDNFDANMLAAHSLLQLYRDRARLLVTTLLHCALPAIAMGIPVMMFYPLNSDAGHQSDCERFSSLKDLISIHRLEDAASLSWLGERVNSGREKLMALDAFLQATARWKMPPRPLAWKLAPSESLPPPG